MSRFPVHGFYQDGAGNMVVSGNATFYEYKAADPSNPDTIATIYTAKTGGSAVASGIITTDSNGAYLAWIDDGDYSAASIFTLILSKSTHIDVPIHFIFSGLSFKDVAETLTNKTLTTPTIASFTNATHDHADAAGGGNTLLVPTIASFANAGHDHADGAGGGTITGRQVQQVYVEDGEVATGTTVVVLDDTIPQITEGIEVMTLAITPTDASNILKIDVVVNIGHSVAQAKLLIALFNTDNHATNALAAMNNTHFTTANRPRSTTFTHRVVAGITDATTFRVRIGSDSAGTNTFNGVSAGRIMGGVMASSITITEIQV